LTVAETIRAALNTRRDLILDLTRIVVSGETMNKEISWQSMLLTSGGRYAEDRDTDLQMWASAEC